MHKKIVIRWNAAALADGASIPPEARKFAQIASAVAGVSFWVSFPMLFFMGAAEPLRHLRSVIRLADALLEFRSE